MHLSSSDISGDSRPLLRYQQDTLYSLVSSLYFGNIQQFQTTVTTCEKDEDEIDNISYGSELPHLQKVLSGNVLEENGIEILLSG